MSVQIFKKLFPSPSQIRFLKIILSKGNENEEMGEENFDFENWIEVWRL